MQTLHVRLTLPLFIGAKVQPKGSVLELEETIARRLVSQGHAEHVVLVREAPAVPPIETRPAPPPPETAAKRR